MNTKSLSERCRNLVEASASLLEDIETGAYTGTAFSRNALLDVWTCLDNVIGNAEAIRNLVPEDLCAQYNGLHMPWWKRGDLN